MSFERLVAPCLSASLLAVIACGPPGEARAARETSARASSATAVAHYLANEGVLVVHGETKVAFDPLFRNGFGTYRLVPEAMERALFEGAPPFDGLDAVFVSHYHEDHFSAADMLRLLRERTDLHLYAPAQAVSGMRGVASEADAVLFDRITSIALEYQDAPVTFETADLLVEAVRIPHSGWPERRGDVENLAFRVTLDQETTVLHLGDADARDEHYAHDADYWSLRHTDLALPPYWYFLSEDGRSVLEDRLKPGHAVGIHVPVEVPAEADDRAPELRDVDLFTTSGETREIPD